MRHLLALSLFSSSLFLACGDKDGDDTGSPGDGGAADGGGADGGTADGGTTDGGTTDELCERSVVNGPPSDACVTDTISCGDSIVDTLVNGAASYSAEEYEAWYCAYTGGDPWVGAERVYAFTHPGTVSVTITLDSPCAEMDLVVLRWGYYATDGECPTGSSTLVYECEMDDGTGGGSLSIWNNESADYLIVVDGVEKAEDVFALTVECP